MAVVRDGRTATWRSSSTPAGPTGRGSTGLALPRARADRPGPHGRLLPEDLTLVKGDPSDRRRFLDDLLVLRAPRLAGVRADYDRCCATQLPAQDGRSGTPRVVLAGVGPLDARVWDAHLARTVASLAERLAPVELLRPYVGKAYETVARGARPRTPRSSTARARIEARDRRQGASSTTDGSAVRSSRGNRLDTERRR